MKLHYKGENPRSVVELQFAISTGKGLWISSYTIWTKRIANKVSQSVTVELYRCVATTFSMGRYELL